MKRYIARSEFTGTAYPQPEIYNIQNFMKKNRAVFGICSLRETRETIGDLGFGGSLYSIADAKTIREVRIKKN